MAGPLAHEPFRFSVLKNESVQVFYKGKLATTISPREGRKFVTKADSQSPAERQLLMARTTGQFKFGNEKLGNEKLARNKSNPDKLS